MAATPNTPTIKKKLGLFSKTKFYVFEYTVFQFAVLSLGVAFATAIFIIFNVAAGNTTISSSLDSLVWVFGLSLVLVPLTVGLYARTSAEESLHPARHEQTPRKFVFYGMLTIATITAVSFLITCVYTVSRVAFGLSDSKAITEIVLPSLVMLLLTAYYIIAIQKNFAPSKKLRRFNIITMSVFGALVAFTILTVASISSSATRRDNQTSEDLETTQKSINLYYRDNDKLPANISDLNDLDSQIKSDFSSGKYKYQPKEYSNDYDTLEVQGASSSTVSYPTGSTRYELCATFDNSESYYGSYYSSGYSSDFSIHKKGYQCFDLYAY